jgi:SAM-dependent methyltransferase
MFLVVGQRGSEAGRVAAALDAHPDLVVAGGGELLLPLAFLVQRVSEPATARRLAADLVVADRGFGDGVGRYLSPDAVAAALADAPLRLGPMLTALYAAVADAAGARQAGTLLTVLGNPVLNRTGLYEGGLRLVHVVRDVRAVVAGSEGHQAPADIARQWDQANRLFRDRRGADPRTYQLVRIEDFVRDPARGLDRLAGFLGVSPAPVTLPATALDAAPPLDAPTREAVLAQARQGLFDFGYDPPERSLRRAVLLAGRRASGLARRTRSATEAARARVWARRAPVPWAPVGDREALAPAACNVCRWSGRAFAGHQHAESADCPRCGTIARERFHLHGLGADAVADRTALLETAPRLAGDYARAMARWFDYRPLAPAPPGSVLGHLAGLATVADDSLDRILTAHDLQSVPDPDAVLAEAHRTLRAGGILLAQVPVLDGVTTALDVPDTAATGTVRWAFGVDVLERFERAGFVADILVTDELAEVVAEGPEAWAKAAGSGEVDLGGVLAAATKVTLTPVADRPSARRRGWLPPVLFWTVRARKA